jgi:signal transduction histidine kinase
MLARLEQAFVAQRLFAAHVSHELRTPLATLRAEADLVAANAEATETERRLAEAARIAVERSDRLITSLLALSRAESGLADSSPVDLADITGAVVSDLTAAADTARVEVDLKLADASVTGDEVLLRSLVENLVRNAITYNYPDGTVSVSVETRDGAAILRVENSGPALTAADVARLTEPFVRGTDSDLARPGVGIGTAVVQAVASAHHGTFTAQARAGGGLRATVTLRQD